MGEETWAAVDEYVGGLLAPHDEALEAALAASAAAGLPSIQVSPPQGKLLSILAHSIGAERMLELGTLGGYSTIWLARALPDDGRLISLEADAAYAEVARGNLERAGVAAKVEVRVGAALETLPRLAREEVGPFDLVFIDADKANTPRYFEWALERARPGGLIVADNVVRDGALIDEENEEPAIAEQRALHEMLAGEPRVEATTIQTVGGKGYDGFAIALVR